MSHKQILPNKLIDLLILFALGGVASIASIVCKLTFVPSTLLYFGIPILYLAFRLQHRSQWHRLSTMAAIFGGLYGFLFAYLAERNLAWAWPSSSFIPGTELLFGVVNPAAWLWVFLWITLIVLFYEHFMERDSRDTLSVRALYALVPGVIVLTLIFFAEHWYPFLLEWRYAYAILAILAFLHCPILLYLRPRIWPKLFIPALFFVPLHMSHEIVGLTLGQWHFPGHYLAIIPVTGNAFVPIEEFVIWILFGSVSVVAYYELYIDDLK